MDDIVEKLYSYQYADWDSSATLLEAGTPFADVALISAAEKLIGVMHAAAEEIVRLRSLVGNDCDDPVPLNGVEVGTMRHLVETISYLKSGCKETKNGFAADYCENAMTEIRKALRLVGG